MSLGSVQNRNSSVLSSSKIKACSARIFGRDKACKVSVLKAYLNAPNIFPTFAKHLLSQRSVGSVQTGLRTMLEVMKMLEACWNKFKFVQTLSQYCFNIFIVLENVGSCWIRLNSLPYAKFVALRYARILSCLLRGGQVLITSFCTTNW